MCIRDRTSGDGYGGGSTVLTPDFDSSVNESEKENNIKMRVSQYGIEILDNDNFNLNKVEVYSVSGRLIYEIQNAKLPLLLKESNLVSGINIIVCRSGEYTRTFKMFN